MLNTERIIRSVGKSGRDLPGIGGACGRPGDEFDGFEVVGGALLESQGHWRPVTAVPVKRDVLAGVHGRWQDGEGDTRVLSDSSGNQGRGRKEFGEQHGEEFVIKQY